MHRTIAVIFCFAAGLQQSAQANDIVDFFRALSGPSHRSHASHRHTGAELAHARHRGGLHGHGHNLHDVGHAHELRSRRSRYGAVDLHDRRYPRTASRSSFSVRFDTGHRPPVYGSHPALPAPPVPGSFAHLPHQLGQFVTCPVPLETCVEYRNPDEIAPGAVPRVIAIRDPHLGRFRSCTEQLAYVQVWVPPCEPRRVRISPCRTRIRLDYGRYDVTIESRNDVIEVSYDD